MKKLKVLGLAAAAAGMVLLTSCLKGNNEYSRQDFAIVDYSSKAGGRVLTYPSSDAPLYISSIANDPSLMLGDGTCVFLTYNVDTDSPDNVNAGANGYYVASGNVLMTVDRSDLYTSMPDTTTVMPREILLKDAGVGGYSKSEHYERLFVAVMPTSLLKDQKNQYYFNCDLTQEPQTIQDTERVYTLFVRATKLTDGTAPTLENGVEYRALSMDYFYSALSTREKAAGKDRINFVITYPTEFNSDSTKITTWKPSKVISLGIAKETDK